MQPFSEQGPWTSEGSPYALGSFVMRERLMEYVGAGGAPCAEGEERVGLPEDAILSRYLGVCSRQRAQQLGLERCTRLVWREEQQRAGTRPRGEGPGQME